MSTDYFLPSQDRNEISAKIPFNTNKCQRPQNSNRQLLPFIAVSIICALTTIGFGSHFFSKLTVHNENLLTSIETKITAMKTSIQTEMNGMEDRINELINDKIDDSSSKLTDMMKKTIDEKNENMKVTLRNLTDEARSLLQGFQNQISLLEKNISGTVEWLRVIEKKNDDFKSMVYDRVSRCKERSRFMRR